MNAELEYIADITILQSLVDQPIKVFAQDSSLSGSVESGVKSYIAEHFDKNQPVSSLAALLGRGLLWSMGFKWMSVLYTVAEALGFNWTGFWSSVGNFVSTFATNIINSGKKATQEETSQKIGAAVNQSFQDSFTGQVDTSQLNNISKKFSSHMENAHELKALAIKLQEEPNITKLAGKGSLIRKLTMFFVRTISRLLMIAFVSCGFVVAVGSAKGIYNYIKNKPTTQEDPNANAKIFKLDVSKSVSPEIFNVHQNDLSGVWIESGEIANIEPILKSWILNTYPQLQSRYSDIVSSSSYQSVLAAFNKRNRLAAGLGMFSVPRPYQRKADVVSAIVNGYLEEEPWKKENNQPQPNQQSAPGQDYYINNKE